MLRLSVTKCSVDEVRLSAQCDVVKCDEPAQNEAKLTASQCDAVWLRIA